MVHLRSNPFIHRAGRRLADSNCCQRSERHLHVNGSQHTTNAASVKRTDLRTVTAVGCVRSFTCEPPADRLFSEYRFALELPHWEIDGFGSLA